MGKNYRSLTRLRVERGGMGYPVGKSVMKMNRNLAQEKYLIKIGGKTLSRKAKHVSHIYLNEKVLGKA